MNKIGLRSVVETLKDMSTQLLRGDFFAPHGRHVLTVTRDGVPEIHASASAVICSASGNVLNQISARDAGEMIIARSTIKPFHAALLLALMEEEKAKNPKAPLPQIAPQEWAVMSSSHSGSDVHLKWVQSAMNKAGLEANYMVCVDHPPLDEGMKNRLIRDGKEPSALHHMCSGHHTCLGMYSQLIDAPVDDYWNPSGKVQQALLAKLKSYCGESEPIQLVNFDNCNIPSFSLPMGTFATLFARLVSEKQFQPVVEAMAAHPILVSDENSLDTLLMQVSNGNLIAKLGAGGMIVVANRARKEAMVLKEWSGVGPHRDRITVQALQEAGWLSPAEAEQLWKHPALSRDIQGTHVRYELDAKLWQEPI